MIWNPDGSVAELSGNGTRIAARWLARRAGNDRVTILTASHHVGDPGWRSFQKPVRIDDYTWIAIGATILPGVTIGYGAVVGAGAVVAKDVPPLAVATGNPAVIRLNARPADLCYDPVLKVFRKLLGKKA